MVGLVSLVHDRQADLEVEVLPVPPLVAELDDVRQEVNLKDRNFILSDCDKTG